MNLCEFPKKTKFQLLYRASEDGFNSANFHDKCDGIKNTLTIVKSRNCSIFGGYTGAAWKSNGCWMNDRNSFIFSLVNHLNDSFKAKCTNNQYSIFGDSSFGPKFGKGADLFISSNSNTNHRSYSNFGHSYKHGTYGQTVLDGSKSFQTTEIEVFEKLN